MSLSLPASDLAGKSVLPRASDAAAGLDMRAIAPDSWDAVSATFDGLSQEQTYAFSKSRWPGLVHEPYVFERGGEVVGGVLVMLQPLPLGLATVAITKWGPMLKDETRGDAAALYAGMVEALVAEFSRRRAMMLSIVPRALEDGLEHRILVDLGFSQGASVPFPDRYVVSLRHRADERMGGFAQKWRAHLRKSLRAGLSFEHAPAAALPEFMVLYDKMVTRKRFADHSAVHTLPALMAMPEGTGRPELFFVRQDGVAKAGAVIFTKSATATYLYGATDDDALDLRAGYFMHWHIIAWLAEHTSARMYDLGGTDGFQGLHQFKRGMVGTLGHVTPIPPMMHIAHAPRAKMLGTLAFAAREALVVAKRRLAGRHDARAEQSAEQRP